jgi:peroxiredoxin
MLYYVQHIGIIARNERRAMTEHTPDVQLESGAMLPAFTLPGADGMPHGPWDYKQRDHLLLIFARSITTSDGRGLLRAFAARYAEFRAEQCAVLAISADTVVANLQAQNDLHLPFPLLADPTGKVIQRYTRWDATTRVLTPSLVLADRYNAVYQQWTADNEADLPPIEELLESLQYLNKLCTP